MSRPKHKIQYWISTPWGDLLAHRMRRAFRLAHSIAEETNEPVKMERLVRHKGEWRSRELTMPPPPKRGVK